MTNRNKDPQDSITVPPKDNYLVKVIDRAKVLAKSSATKYAGSGASAGVIVGGLLIGGPLAIVLGAAVGGGLGGYLGLKRAAQPR